MIAKIFEIIGITASVIGACLLFGLLFDLHETWEDLKWYRYKHCPSQFDILFKRTQDNYEDLLKIKQIIMPEKNNDTDEDSKVAFTDEGANEMANNIASLSERLANAESHILMLEYQNETIMSELDNLKKSE